MATSEVEKQLKGAFEAFTTSMEAKYRPWLYETPLYIDGTRVAFLQESQRIMLKLMRYISENYAEIEHCLPHDEEVRAFLRELQEVPFQEGTFRTDFVVNEQDEVRLIEVQGLLPSGVTIWKVHLRQRASPEDAPQSMATESTTRLSFDI